MHRLGLVNMGRCILHPKRESTGVGLFGWYGVGDISIEISIEVRMELR